MDRFESAMEGLDQFPRANRVRPELPAPNLRYAPADPALLIYRILDDGDCEVVRVAHKAQDIPTLFDFDDAN